MSDFTIGMVLGLGVGLAIGIYIGVSLVKRKPWSEITSEEKKRVKLLTGACIVVLLAGVIVNLWFYFGL